ncbi:probable glutathione peroxidase 8 isoform X2 [Lepidochelys kempii]|uniref:probable glutathione peroxidase 8 isoform X2 n=1 Tax=Lepidochelys kempii TaxID=8472 RepID=UPI003C6F7EC6
MEPLATYPLKCSVPKARVFVVFLSMVLCTVMLCLLQLKFLKPKIKDFYSFEVKDSRGRTVSLEKYRGKELHREFGPSHFTVLAFPCNQFGESEPSSSQEIESFAKGNYGATFPIFHKIKILGSETEPAFKFLIDSSKKEPRWNFWKYLVSPEGKVVKFWRPEEPIENIKPEVASLIRQIILKKKEDL